MPKTVIKIKTWRCSCDYAQDFEPTKEAMDKHFLPDAIDGRAPKKYQALWANLQVNQCPSCGAPNGLQVTNNPEKQTTITVMGEEEIGDLIKIDGQIRYISDADQDDQARIEAAKGKPVILVKREALTTEEQTAIKQKIKADIAKFSAMT